MSKLFEHRREIFYAQASYCTCQDCKDHWPNVDCPCELCDGPPPLNSNLFLDHVDDECWEIEDCACSKCYPNPPPRITSVIMEEAKDWQKTMEEAKDLLNDEPSRFQKLLNFIIACFKC